MDQAAQEPEGKGAWWRWEKHGQGQHCSQAWWEVQEAFLRVGDRICSRVPISCSVLLEPCSIFHLASG